MDLLRVQEEIGFAEGVFGNGGALEMAGNRGGNPWVIHFTHYLHPTPGTFMDGHVAPLGDGSLPGWEGEPAWEDEPDELGP